MFHFFPEYEVGQLITTWEWSTIILKILNITSVPYHRFQAAAPGKCLFPDSCYGVGYGYRFQAAALGKCLFPDSCYGVAYCHRFQAVAKVKCPVSNGSYGVGYGYLCQM